MPCVAGYPLPSTADAMVDEISETRYDAAGLLDCDGTYGPTAYHRFVD